VVISPKLRILKTMPAKPAPTICVIELAKQSCLIVTQGFVPFFSQANIETKVEEMAK